MENYYINYDQIASQWEMCREEIEECIRDILGLPFAEVAGRAKSQQHQMALSVMNYRFIEVVPKKMIDGKLRIISDWDNQGDWTHRVSCTVKEVSEKYDFQYEGIEIDYDGKPLFVVKVGE